MGTESRSPCGVVMDVTCLPCCRSGLSPVVVREGSTAYQQPRAGECTGMYYLQLFRSLVLVIAGREELHASILSTHPGQGAGCTMWHLQLEIGEAESRQYALQSCLPSFY